MIKVLLTGAKGQIGSEITRIAPEYVKLFSCDKQLLDITSAYAIKSAFDRYRPDVVINTAAYTAVDNAEKEPELAYAINATGALYLADECQKAAIPMIQISTDYIFNGRHDRPYREVDHASPLNVYGKSKWEGELAIRHVLSQHIILRTSWVFSDFGNNFVKTILRLARDQAVLRIVSDQYGCPTAAKDIAGVIWHIIKQISQSKNIPWGTYHFTNVQQVSWYDFAKKILSMASLNKDVIAVMTTDYPTLAKRPAYSVLNCQKIMDRFQIIPRHWEIALKEVVTALSTTTVSNPSLVTCLS